MSIQDFLKSPLIAWADFRKRRELKFALLKLMRERAAGMENAIQFEGITLDNPTPESATILLVLRDIVNEDRQFSIVQWPGGISLARTANVDNLAKEQQQVNESANFIIRGGSDKSADLLSADNIARPTGSYKGNGE
jgi:hypothetical protein